MVSAALKYCLSFLMFVSWGFSIAQGHLFSEVHANKSRVYVGEPVEVSVSVYTSTWFTKGVDPGNVKVNGAYTVYFRGVSESKQINGKTYAGVKMIFNVFPYEDEDLVFPSVEFKVETPDEGGYKGVLRTVKTKPKTIAVKPVPAGYDKAAWLVSAGVEVRDNWKRNSNTVKVGDVLERHITRTAAGTVSGLIPPIAWDSIPGVSAYPTRPEAKNIKTKTSISARRTEGIKYLFEKAGRITIPKVEITWWNPYRQKPYKRTLNEITFDVLPNPDLGMLESLRDSLTVSASAGEDEATGKSPFTIFGLTLKRALSLSLAVILTGYLIFRFIKRAASRIKKRRMEYIRSEKYFFAQLKSAAKRGDAPMTVRALYQWIDRLHLQEPTARYFALTYGNGELIRELDNLVKSITNGENIKPGISIKNLNSARAQYLKHPRQTGTVARAIRINP